MARRNGSAVDLFLVLPRWVSAITGVLSYIVMVYIVPASFPDNPYAPVMVSACRMLAPFVCLAFVLIGVGSAVRSILVARKFDRQAGLADIRRLSWRQFEMIVGEAFRRRGYSVVEHVGGGADGGVDLVLRRDGKKILVQCKQWRVLRVGVKPVRELCGVVSARRAAGGIFVNSGTYTNEAKDFAAQSGIQLIDGAELALMIRDAQSQAPYIEPTNWGSRDNTSFASGDDSPQCPNCGKAMVLRAARRGANAGSQFWGCPGFPGCRGTRRI